MANFDILGIAILALFIGLGVGGFVAGLHNNDRLNRHSERIEKLEEKLKKL